MHDELTGRRVGWIGVGRMGRPFAERLLRAGADVAVYNRTREKALPLAELGATLVETPADLADRDVVFTTVSGPADLLAVTVGERGLLTAPGVAPGILVDISTVSEAAAAEVRRAGAAVGTQVLAAPVSGNGDVVSAGRATFVVSGPAEAFAAAEPYLAALGRGAHYVGEDDRARLVKIGHNLLLTAVLQSLVETTLLMQAAGIARADYLAFLNDSAMGSPFSVYKTQALTELDWTTTFTLPLLRKDLDLGLAAASEHGVPLPITERAREMVQAAIDEGHVEDDFAVLLEVQAAAAGLTLAPERAVPDAAEAKR